MNSVSGSQGKSQTQPDGGEGYSGMATGYRRRCFGRKPSCRGRVPQRYGVTYRNRV